MATEADLQSAPDIGESSVPGPVPVRFLSAQWINARILNVEARATAYFTRLIDEGLLSSGYLPFESPVTDDMLTRMTPDQLQMLIDTSPSIGAKLGVINRLKALHVPVDFLHIVPPQQQRLLPQPFSARQLRLGDISGTSEPSVGGGEAGMGAVE